MLSLERWEGRLCACRTRREGAAPWRCTPEKPWQTRHSCLRGETWMGNRAFPVGPRLCACLRRSGPSRLAADAREQPRCARTSETEALGARWLSLELPGSGLQKKSIISGIVGAINCGLCVFFLSFPSTVKCPVPQLSCARLMDAVIICRPSLLKFGACRQLCVGCAGWMRPGGRARTYIQSGMSKRGNFSVLPHNKKKRAQRAAGRRRRLAWRAAPPQAADSRCAKLNAIFGSALLPLTSIKIRCNVGRTDD